MLKKLIDYIFKKTKPAALQNPIPIPVPIKPKNSSDDYQSELLDNWHAVRKLLK